MNPLWIKNSVVGTPKIVLLRVLGRRPAGVASVLYLTSDAGEGKTTLISHLARQQCSCTRPSVKIG